MSGPLVLAVDDAEIYRSVVVMLLGQLGCRTLTVDSGEAAIAAIAAHPVDLVLMDCAMPGMDGFEATAAIRRDQPPGRCLPIIALSGYDQPKDLARCHAAGMDGHLVKPLQLTTLRAVLERWLGWGGSGSYAVQTGSSRPVVLDPGPLAGFERMRLGSGAVLLSVFSKDLSTVQGSIGRAVEESDVQAVARLSHKLKGSSLTIGANALGLALRGLNQAARDEDVSLMRDRWQALGPLFAATHEAIRARVPAVSTQEARRVSPAVLSMQCAIVNRAPGLAICLEAMGGPSVVLNADRQILASNRRFRELVGGKASADLVGRRLGEAIGCQNAGSTPAGCGSAAGCSFCGAFQSIASALRENSQTTKEVRLTIGAESGHALDLEVTVTPLPIEGTAFALLAMRDIADHKRRLVLERLFFHDMRNSLGGIHGLAGQLASGRIPADEQAQALAILERSTRYVVEEVQYQQMLTRAEVGELIPGLRSTDAGVLMREVCEAYTCHPASVQRSLALGQITAVAVRTDRLLFQRVIGNLVRNALEATPPGGRVTLACREADGQVLCTVHNPGEMPTAVSEQIFHRSFTTKGPGRGLGTWSAKLLGERYLGGRLSFTSGPSGTEMTFAVPREPA